MSSLFSYELDEAQIRLTLQNSKAVEYNESSWDDFESNFLQTSTNQTHAKFKLPDFHLNINRNVVLPVIFIAALVGISAIMLSFIDFKTNVPKQVEKSLIPNPDNFKPTFTKAVSMPKKEQVKAIENPVIKTDTTTRTIANSAIVTQSQVAVSINPVNQSQLTNTVTQARTTTDTGSITKTDNQPEVNNINQTPPGKKRKRRRKMPTEQIETIKAPSILGVETTAAEKEPELEIKFN